MRRKLVETGDVDVMVAIRPNFFYTRTVPCELWFYDRGKPAERRDTVLMLDARQVFRKVGRLCACLANAAHADAALRGAAARRR